MNNYSCDNSWTKYLLAIALGLSVGLITYPAQAEERNVNYILAFGPLKELDKVVPKMLEPFKSKDGCWVKALQLNATDKDLNSPEAKEGDWKYFCLEIQDVSV